MHLRLLGAVVGARLAFDWDSDSVIVFDSKFHVRFVGLVEGDGGASGAHPSWHCVCGDSVPKSKTYQIKDCSACVCCPLLKSIAYFAAHSTRAQRRFYLLFLLLFLMLSHVTSGFSVKSGEEGRVEKLRECDIFFKGATWEFCSRRWLGDDDTKSTPNDTCNNAQAG